MNNTLKLYDMAQMAEASYAELNSGMSGASFAQSLQEDTSNSPLFSKVQADYFSSKWFVNSHIPNTPSGFSATIFEEISTGIRTLAIRGTEMTADSYNDLIIADGAGISLNGAAFEQIVDMYNYWQSLITPVGSHYVKAEWHLSYSEPDEGVITEFRDDIHNTVQYASIIKSTSMDYGLGLLSPSDKLDVVGHSLGGHLAMAFSRLFPENVNDMLTVNGAGFSRLATLNNFFDTLAGHPTSFTKTIENLNLYGDKNLEIMAICKIGLEF